MPDWNLALIILDHGPVWPVVPLGAFLMAIIIVAITSFRKTRERELQAHQELRMREMEHERQMKQMEIDRTKLELEVEKSKSQKVS